MKILIYVLTRILLGITVIVFMVMFLPIILIVLLFNYYSNWTKEKEFKKYINSLGNKNFFCYNNRMDTKDFIEKELIPKLNKDIDLIYLEGREPKSKYVQDYISLALLKLKNYSRFPHLLKIRDGQLIDESVNNEFFNTVNQNKSLDKLIVDINKFFDLSIENKYAAE